MLLMISRCLSHLDTNDPNCEEANPVTCVPLIKSYHNLQFEEKWEPVDKRLDKPSIKRCSRKLYLTPRRPEYVTNINLLDDLKYEAVVGLDT